MSSNSMFCSRLFLLLTLLMKYTMQNHCLIYGTQVLILGKTETLWLCHRQWQYTLLRTNCFYLIKCQWYTGSYMPVLHFSADHALLQKKILWGVRLGGWGRGKKGDKSLHTTATEINIGNYWPQCCHTFPNTYVATEMPLWQTPLRVIIWTESLTYRNKNTGK